MKTYWDALKAGAVTTLAQENPDEDFPTVMNLNIIENPGTKSDPVEDKAYMVAAGVGMFGMAYANLIESVSMDEYPKTFSDGDAFKSYLDDSFIREFGLSIVGVIRGLESANIRWGLSPKVYLKLNSENPPTDAPVGEFDHFGDYVLTFYYMDEGVEPSGGAKVTTETISGPLSTIFNDNGYTKEKFVELINDIYSGKASAAISLGKRANTTIKVFMSPLMAGDEPLSLMLCASNNNTANNLTLSAAFLYVEDENSIVCAMTSFNGATGEWSRISDDQLSQMTGQSSYDLVITRIEEK